MRRTLGFTLLELTLVLLLLIVLAGLILPYTATTVAQSACQATDATLAAVREAIAGGSPGPGYYSDLDRRLPYYRAAGGNEDCHDDDNASGGTPRYHLHFLFAVSTFGSPAKSLCPKELQSFRSKLALGWRGPYLQGGAKLPQALDASFNNVTYVHTKPQDHADDFYVLDHYRYRNPIVLQVPPESEDCPTHPGTLDGQRCARLVSAGPNGQLDTRIDDPDASSRGDDRVLFVFVPDPHQNAPCAQ